tara:strand:+ start:108 stop:302 length:195 start_codon:yes stop_codon:yes gene_type:complete
MIKSPCVDVCKIDPESKACLGCNRTIEEIANWSSLNDSEKKNILTKIKNFIHSNSQIIHSNEND